MNRKHIKNNGDDFLPRYIAKEIELIKEELGIIKGAEFYFLGCYWWSDYFLCNNTVYVVNWNWSQIKANRDNLDTSKMELISLFSCILLKEEPKTIEDIEFKTIIKGELEYDATRFLTCALYFAKERMLLTDFIYDDIYDNFDGNFLVQIGNQRKYIDTNGKEITITKDAKKNKFHCGYASIFSHKRYANIHKTR